jgi:vacuolar protein sorting-associated protein 13B
MLESYVTPILMSYVNRYIKNLKPSDLQLSLWGGDVVLSKLELKLDVLEQVSCVAVVDCKHFKLV